MPESRPASQSPSSLLAPREQGVQRCFKNSIFRRTRSSNKGASENHQQIFFPQQREFWKRAPGTNGLLRDTHPVAHRTTIFLRSFAVQRSLVSGYLSSLGSHGAWSEAHKGDGHLQTDALREHELSNTLENIDLKTETKQTTKQLEIAPVPNKKLTLVSKENAAPKFRCNDIILQCTSFEEILLKGCSHQPLHALHTVNCILNSKSRTMFGEHELKGPLNVYLYQSVEQKAERLKKFLAKVEGHYRENVQAKFHGKPKINGPIRYGDEARAEEIKLQREQEWEDYRNSVNDERESLFGESETRKTRRRILRLAQKHPTMISVSSQREEPIFRYYKIQPFVQTARKIVIRNRLIKVLAKLQNVTAESITRFEGSSVSNQFVPQHS